MTAARSAGRTSRSCRARPIPTRPTIAEVLRKTIIYFTYPNPDGWRRGDVSEGGVFFQRYNGNGVDLNRDWPDIGFSFRPYSGLSEPESRALATFFDDVKATTGDEFDAGDDLHGQLTADALSYTLLPHGRHDFAKDQRIRDTAIAIHRASEKALLVVADHPAERLGAGIRAALRARAARQRLRADLRADLGHGLRHDQLHDHRRAGRLLRLVDRPRRGRDRQRDVVLAPRQEHRLRPAHRAAPRGREQGADLRPPRAARQPGDQGDRRARPPGLRAQRPPAAPGDGVPAGRAAGHLAAGRHREPGRHARGRTSRARSSSRSRSSAAPRSSTAACGSTSPRRASRASATATAHAARAVQGLRRASRSPRERRVGDGQRGLQPVAGLPPGRADRGGQPAAVGQPERPEGGVAGDPRRAGRGADERGLHLGPRHHRRRHRRRRPAAAGGLRRGQHGLLRGPEHATSRTTTSASCRSGGAGLARGPELPGGGRPGAARRVHERDSQLGAGGRQPGAHRRVAEAAARRSRASRRAPSSSGRSTSARSPSPRRRTATPPASRWPGTSASPASASAAATRRSGVRPSSRPRSGSRSRTPRPAWTSRTPASGTSTRPRSRPRAATWSRRPRPRIPSPGPRTSTT